MCLRAQIERSLKRHTNPNLNKLLFAHSTPLVVGGRLVTIIVHNAHKYNNNNNTMITTLTLSPSNSFTRLSMRPCVFREYESES